MGRPRRSAIFGTLICRTPSSRTAVARDASQGCPRRTILAKRPGPPGRLFTSDQHGRPAHEDADGGGIGAREVDGNFDGAVGLEDVDRRRALAGQRLEPERPAQLDEDLADIVGELADLGREHHGVNSGAHRRMIAHVGRGGLG